MVKVGIWTIVSFFHFIRVLLHLLHPTGRLHLLELFDPDRRSSLPWGGWLHLWWRYVVKCFQGPSDSQRSDAPFLLLVVWSSDQHSTEGMEAPSYWSLEEKEELGLSVMWNLTVCLCFCCWWFIVPSKSGSGSAFWLLWIESIRLGFFLQTTMFVGWMVLNKILTSFWIYFHLLNLDFQTVLNRFWGWYEIIDFGLNSNWFRTCFLWLFDIYLC